MEKLIKNGGNQISNEVGKFKFLNSFIRILSPKYQGATTSEMVRTKAINLLSCCKESLRHLSKISQVYELLVKENVIKEKNTIEEIHPLTVENRKKSLASFENEEKAQLLSQLLKSNKVEDLQAANKMIKCMVREVSFFFKKLF